MCRQILILIFYNLCLKNLSPDFAEFLWNFGFSTLLLVGPSGVANKCDLLHCRVPRRSIKIGKSWKHFCVENGLRMNDEIVFEFYNGNANLVKVKK